MKCFFVFLIVINGIPEKDDSGPYEDPGLYEDSELYEDRGLYGGPGRRTQY